MSERSPYWEDAFKHGRIEDGEVKEVPEANMDYAEALYFDNDDSISKRRAGISKRSLYAKKIIYKLEKALTIRQLEVIRLIKVGKSIGEISYILEINQSAVSRHLKLIRKKLKRILEKYPSNNILGLPQ